MAKAQKDVIRPRHPGFNPDGRQLLFIELFINEDTPGDRMKSPNNWLGLRL